MVEKKINAILHTGGKSDEELVWDGGMVSEEDIPWLRAVANSWDGIEVQLHQTDAKLYDLVGWDECDCEIDAKVKEAIWQMEQDPVFGTYYKDRDAFDDAWREGKYEAAAGITFMARDVEIINESNEERFVRIVSDHPGMQIIPMVEYEVVGDDECRRWAGSIGSCHVSEYIYTEEGSMDGARIWQRHEAGDLVDLMAENAEERPEFFKPGQNPLDTVAREEAYQAARQRAWKQVEAMPWKRAIILYVNLPDAE